MYAGGDCAGRASNVDAATTIIKDNKALSTAEPPGPFVNCGIPAGGATIINIHL